TPWARRSRKRSRKATRFSRTLSTSPRSRSCATTGSCSATDDRTSMERSPRSTDGAPAEGGSIQAAQQGEELGGTAAHLRLETRVMTGIAGAPGGPRSGRRPVDDDLAAAVESKLHRVARPHTQRVADPSGEGHPSLGAYSCCHRNAFGRGLQV